MSDKAIHSKITPQNQPVSNDQTMIQSMGYLFATALAAVLGAALMIGLTGLGMGTAFVMGQITAAYVTLFIHSATFYSVSLAAMLGILGATFSLTILGLMCNAAYTVGQEIFGLGVDDSGLVGELAQSISLSYKVKHTFNRAIHFAQGSMLRILSILTGTIGAISTVGLFGSGFIATGLLFEAVEINSIFMLVGIIFLSASMMCVGLLLAMQCFDLFFGNEFDDRQGLFYTLSEQADQAFEKAALDVNTAYSEQANQGYFETRGQSSDPKSEGVLESSPEQVSSEQRFNQVMTVEAVHVHSDTLSAIQGPEPEDAVKVEAEYVLNGTEVHGRSSQPGMN